MPHFIAKFGSDARIVPNVAAQERHDNCICKCHTMTLIQFGTAIAIARSVPRHLNTRTCNKRAKLNYVVGESVSLS